MSALRHAVAARYRFIPQVLLFLIHAVSEASPAASPPPQSASRPARVGRRACGRRRASRRRASV
jgi:hypothetical protein